MGSEYLREDAILKPEELAKLGPLGQNLFAAAWNRMRSRNSEAIWINDLEMCNRARIRPDILARIQNELDQSGLMVVTPGLKQTRYGFVDTQD